MKKQTAEMNTIKTPFNIDVLLHCYTRRSPYENFKYEESKRAFHELEGAGLIEETDKENIWKTTEKGECLVRALCDTPIPKQKYYIPGKESE